MWRENGPQSLNTVKRDVEGNPIAEEIVAAPEEKSATPKSEELPKEQPAAEEKSKTNAPEAEEVKPAEDTERAAEPEPKADEEEGSPTSYHSGIWLFTDRENITHFFAPNFLPPYNTPEKRKIIMNVLKEEWDEKTLSWKPCGEGSMTKKPAPAEEHLKEKDSIVEEKKDDDSTLQIVDAEKDAKMKADNSFGKTFDNVVN